MRKTISLLLLLALLCPVVTATAEEYAFEEGNFSLSVPSKVYDTILTRNNLVQYADFLTSQGKTPESALVEFTENDILLQAYDKTSERMLIVSAVKDTEATQYFDINQHTPEVRAHYRRIHGKDGPYASQGYAYDSVEWRNFRDVGRFLMLRYSLRQDGKVVGRGFQRRTIRNGYTITVDMRAVDRQAKGADNTALNKVFDTLRFTSVLPLPELPVQLMEKKTAPAETSQPEFEMSGKTKPGAKLYAAVTSFTASKADIYEVFADKKGNYKFTVTLPREDLYLMTLTVTHEGSLPLELHRSINYQIGMLPVTLDSIPPEELTADTLIISGATDPGVTVQLNVNDINSSKRTNNNRTFSFKVDTSKEGDYQIRLVLSKKGFETRTYTYTAKRVFDDATREARLKKSAVRPKYDALIKGIDKYDGRVVEFTGTILSKEEKAGEWITVISTRQRADQMEDRIVLSSFTDNAFPINTKVRVYGTVVGMSSFLNDQQTEVTYPKLQLSIMESAE
ncbi:MAG: hypothetical protein ACOX58_01740 [Christensenellales bacterium]|jgi:hypothetical protein